MSTDSQCALILKHLREHDCITARDAAELYGSLACHSRISELRERGHVIHPTHRSCGKTRWVEYRLVEPVVACDQGVPLVGGSGE